MSSSTIRDLAERLIPPPLRRLAYRQMPSGNTPPAAVRRWLDDSGGVDKGTQILLALKYRELLRNGGPFPEFEDVEFRSYSQNGEDGLLLYVFSLVGTTNRRVVEICAGNGIECNAANLIVNHGWSGLLVDGDERNVQTAIDFYATCRDTCHWGPTVARAWITKESVNTLIWEHGFDGEVDLLSLDLDGNDYWIWEAATAVNPRVVILEFENAFGAEYAVSQPYDPEFVCRVDPRGFPTYGASLPAFVGLGRRKGYRLVGVNQRCFNAVFLREDVGTDLLPEVAVEDCFGHPLAEYRMAMWREHLAGGEPDPVWVRV